MAYSPPASMSTLEHKVHTVWDFSAVWLLSGCRAALPLESLALQGSSTRRTPCLSDATPCKGVCVHDTTCCNPHTYSRM